MSVVYDGDGNRVSETVGGVTTKLLVDSLNPSKLPQVMDEIVNGSVTRTYTYGRQRVSENQLVSGKWVPSFYGYDGHGNVRFLTSSSGTVGNTYTFDAFGAQIASTGSTANNFLYSGEWLDPNLSLYNLRARYYNMLTGRFMTMDPYAGRIFDPATLHKYVYTKNNPVNLLDPKGTDIIENAILNSRIPQEAKDVIIPTYWAARVFCFSAALVNATASPFSFYYNNGSSAIRGYITYPCTLLSLQGFPNPTIQ